MRVQNAHWSLVLDFAEKYPQIITNKFMGPKGREQNLIIWNQLTTALNSIGLGQKTKEEWKKTLTDWKSKTKSKAGLLTKEKVQTGGGPATSIFLNEHEERLLNIMGKSSYEGNPTNLERGFRKRKLFITEDMPQVHSHTEDLLYDHNYTSTNSNETLTQEIIMPSTDLLTIDFPQSSSQLNVINSLTNAQDVVPVHKTPTSQLDITSQTNATTFIETPTNNTVKLKRSSCKSRQPTSTETFTKMHTDLLIELRQLNVTLTTMSDSLKDISNTLKI